MVSLATSDGLPARSRYWTETVLRPAPGASVQSLAVAYRCQEVQVLPSLERRICATPLAGAGSMARAGATQGLYFAEMIASAILLAGFLMASTLQKGAAIARKEGQERRAAEAQAASPTTEEDPA